MKNNNITTTIRTLLTAAAILTVPLITPTALLAQSPEPFSPYGDFSPSVESYQMTRCGNLLPSLYTGAMTFSLPLMTYSDPDFTIPVTLQYSYDGYKPGQHSGTVGYGWYLDCGGVITREVRGIPDEGDLDGGGGYNCPVFGWRHAGSYRDSLEIHPDRVYSFRKRPEDHSSTESYVGLLSSYDPFNDKPVYAAVSGSGQGYSLYDTAPDIYHFRFLGHSGDFMMLTDGSVRVYNSDIPYGELSVRFTDYGNDPCYVTITLTTGDGYEYKFVPEGVSETPDAGGDHPLRPSKSVSAYRLAEIVAPNRRKVTFTYRPYYTPILSFQYGPFLEGAYLTIGIQQEDCQQGSVYPEFEKRRAFIREAAACLEKVLVFEAGGTVTSDSLVFTYASAPGDEGAKSCFESEDPFPAFVPEDTAPVLATVAMYGDDGLADSASFTYESASLGTPKTFLRSVTGMKTGTHAFDYALDGFTLPKNDTQGTDHWGYWNGSVISDLRKHLTETEWMFPVQHDESEPIAVPTPGADTTYIFNHQDTAVVRRCAAHLYDQMIDSVKEADPSFAICGALTRIRYPHGGKTVVEYEPNRVTRRMNVRATDPDRSLEPVDSLDAAADWIVGGVRVRSLVDSTGIGHCDTTRFVYGDPDANGRGSGILMTMPKYTEAAQYTIRVYSLFASQGLSGVADVYAIGFNNCCGFVLTRDPHVVYPAVTVIHPDGSSTEHRFTSVTDLGLGDCYSAGWSVTKHILGKSDKIESRGRTPTCMIPASLDCRNLRGQPKRTVVRNSAGVELKRTEYTYSDYQVTIPRLGFNNILTFNLAPYTVLSPQLVSTVETERGVTVRTDRSYNPLGQVSVTSVTQSPLAGGGSASPYGTVSVKMRYRHETGDTTRFRTLPDAAARTRTCGTAEYLLAREHYSYRSGKWQLSQIRSFTPDTSALIHSGETVFSVAAGPERTSTFDYYDDGSDRLKKVTFPGGNSLNYTWDGTHLTSKAVNDTSNMTLYEWEDQIGLTKITLPSGCSETYLYDSAARPWKTLDTDTLTVSVINYRLKNQ